MASKLSQGTPGHITGNIVAITAAAMSSALMSVLDISIVNVGLSDIRASFGTPLDQIAWVSTGYAMANITVIPMSWQPSDLPAGLAQLNIAEARVRQTQAQLHAVEEALRVEVKQAVLGLKETEVALESTRKAQASAEEGYRVRQELFINGRSTAVEVIDSETELTRARLEALNAQIDARIARVRFDHAVGADLR